MRYEYKVVSAPRRALRIKGIATSEARFAATLAEAINAEATGGWEYFRTDALAQEERTGLLRSRVETTRAMLVFRRPIPPALPDFGAETRPDTTALAARRTGLGFEDADKSAFATLRAPGRDGDG